jgi:hypothetical protein
MMGNRPGENFPDDLSDCALAVRRYSEGRQPARPMAITGDVMTQYLVAIHHPDDYDPSVEGEAMHRDIDVLNDEMKAAGAGIFVGEQRESAAADARWRGARHRWTVSGDQGACRRFLGARSRQPGRSAGVGPQGRRRLPGAGRGARVLLTADPTEQLARMCQRGFALPAR